eukprot:gnl/MRDRNA2_/MRDRNA2_128880_c0_seq1.p1 gnl/MRDRNA2_/MRDRNA2_128880_c0~~gnl/MRDRNA2_/MRDRNA2_128880_c0_seq1.p1  ORF type:complete len:292 (-),score=39.66 gnl/MRDRNA2_/MRDRNA2_128880_c0_seq1:228-1103(-)
MPLRRPVSCPSQARLLHSRGDLGCTRTSFNVPLAEPSPIVRPGELHRNAEAHFARGGMARTGLQLKRAQSRLVVTNIDRDWRRKTPAARWNHQEEQQAHRGDYEYVSHAIRPGDRIKAVNDFNNVTGMLGELQDAGRYTLPKKVSLEISRDIADVLQPGPPASRSSDKENISPSMPDADVGTTRQAPRSPTSDAKSPWSGERVARSSSLCPSTKPPRPRGENNILKPSGPMCSRPWSGDEASTRSPSVSSREASVTRNHRSASNGPQMRRDTASASSPVLTQAGLVAASRR